MTKARKHLISIQNTPYYHVVSRCVRRSYLCGEDKLTGKNYEHRRQWIEDRIRILSSIFSVEICAYAVMSNHFHIAIKLCPEETEDLTDQEIVERWTNIFKGTRLIQQWQAGDNLQPAELHTVNDTITLYRQRLNSLSWFMKCLNEPIARQANQEDGCRGHFWEARFTSQALVTEEALLSCMAYIDLNPIRAAMATTPEASDHTSIKERIKPCFNVAEAIKQQIEQHALLQFTVPIKPLARFEGGVIEQKQTGILFTFNDYLQLVDYTGRVIRADKRGSIPIQTPAILKRLSIDHSTWLANSTAFEANYNKKFRRHKQNVNNTA